MEYPKTTLEENLESILEVAKLSFNHFYEPLQLSERLKDRKSWIRLAKDKNKIVGFGIWYEEGDKTIYCWLGAIRPDYRNSMASKFMILQMQELISLGYEKFRLKTHEGHPEIIKTITKRDFKEVKREHNHWKDGKTAIFFEYNLNNQL